MALTVALTDHAQEEFEAVYAWWATNRSRTQADRWYAGFAEAIQSLSIRAESCPLAREDHLFS